MPRELDPYRTLGLTRAATLDEIRRAYRRLAKANHPDSAGDAALPRFLAIQAAYEALVEAPGGGPTGGRPPGARAGEPWRADPDRARATSAGRRPGARAAGGEARTGSASGAASRRRPGARPESTTGTNTDGGGGRSAPSGGPASAARQGDGPRRGRGRSRPSNRATPGSTTYDVAEEEPFEPEWSGGTWYGASSGTYWTINPKEYADPRKHGPEYQRRARRQPDVEPSMTEGPAAGASTDPQAAFSVDGSRRADDLGDGSTFGETPAGDGPAPGEAAPGSAGLGSSSASRLRTAFIGRIGLALIGWPPIGIAISTFSGELSGCGRFAASCVDLFGIGTWLAQLAVIAILLALPAIAELSAAGSIVALAASVPTAVALSASGGSREPAASAAALGFILAIAYVIGVVVALVRRLRYGHVPFLR
jgi:hypothetical protein